MVQVVGSYDPQLYLIWMPNQQLIKWVWPDYLPKLSGQNVPYTKIREPGQARPSNAEMQALVQKYAAQITPKEKVAKVAGSLKVKLFSGKAKYVTVGAIGGGILLVVLAITGKKGKGKKK